MTNETTNKIAELNDLCRSAMGVAGRLLQTAGISALPSADQSAIREKVEKFDAFTPENDPYGGCTPKPRKVSTTYIFKCLCESGMG